MRNALSAIAYLIASGATKEEAFAVFERIRSGEVPRDLGETCAVLDAELAQVRA